MESPTLLDRGDGVRLAVRAQPGSGPGLLFLPGYASDMRGSKAEAVAAWAAARGRACVRFDYSGCGESEGAFLDGTIGRWLADAAAVLDAHPGPTILIGSSMGGWLALLLALARPEAVRALVLIAPAPDFTQWGLVDTLTSDERAALARQGFFERANIYGPEPTRYSRALIEDGAQRLLLARPVPFTGPVRILHGQADPDVPWRLSLDLAERLASADVQLHLVKDGDHRLSRPGDLALLLSALEHLPL